MLYSPPLSRYNPYNTEIFVSKPWILTKGFFQFEIVINVLASSFRFTWIPMLFVYGHYKCFYSYSAGIDFRRQNLTSTIWRLTSIPALEGLKNVYIRSKQQRCEQSLFPQNQYYLMIKRNKACCQNGLTDKLSKDMCIQENINFFIIWHQLKLATSSTQPRYKASCVEYLLWIYLDSSHHPQEVLPARFSLHAHKGDIKSHLFYFWLHRLATWQDVLSL